MRSSNRRTKPLLELIRDLVCQRRGPGAEPAMYTSEPLPGVQSPFYVGERYVADAETARRARVEKAAP